MLASTVVKRYTKVVTYEQELQNQELKMQTEMHQTIQRSQLSGPDCLYIECRWKEETDCRCESQEIFSRATEGSSRE